MADFIPVEKKFPQNVEVSCAAPRVSCWSEGGRIAGSLSSMSVIKILDINGLSHLSLFLPISKQHSLIYIGCCQHKKGSCFCCIAAVFYCLIVQSGVPLQLLWRLCLLLLTIDNPSPYQRGDNSLTVSRKYSF